MTCLDQFEDFDIAEFEAECAELELRISGVTSSIIDASVRCDRAIQCLKGNGIKTIIRYYCRDPGGSWKTLEKSEADTLITEFSIAVVHEIGARPSLFSYASGKLDAEFSARYGRSVIGQPANSAIYFAVDFDADASTIRNRIIPYFKGVKDGMEAAGSPYKIGIYGSGLTCATLLKKGLVSFAWLAQSTGWREYTEFKSSRLWSIVQKPSTSLCRIEVDYDDAQDGRDFGAFSSLEPLVELRSDSEIAEEENLLVSSALSGLDPDMKSRVLLLVQECARNGVKMVPASGVRTPQSQAKLWRQSRTSDQVATAIAQLRARGAVFLAEVLDEAGPSSGPHVTNALPGMSWHQWGEAVDCYWEVEGRVEWDPDASHNGVKGYHVYADLAESNKIGLTAGGHWSRFKDWPHVQLRKASAPQSVYSIREIDNRMRDLYGERLDVAAGVFAPRALCAANNSERVIRALEELLSEL